jgi:UDP-3-O-[3-hydroxymyristoyl] glucosamine N-acyltransferase
MIGGSAMIVGHLDIADRVTLHAAAFVTKSIKQAGTYAGYPAEENRGWRRALAMLRRTDALHERLHKIEQYLSTRKEHA